MAVQPQGKLTYEDFLNFPDDGLRRELIDGVFFVTPAPNIRHQDIVLRLAVAFSNHLQASGGGRVFVAPCDVVLSANDVVEPDVLFVAHDRTGIITEPNIQGPPSLVVEVVSDPATDRRRKRDLYARFGVPEYWIVDPEADRVEVYRLREGGYGKPEILEPGEMLTTGLLPGMGIDLTDLLRRDEGR